MAQYAREVSQVREVLGLDFSDGDIIQAVFLCHGKVDRAVDRLLTNPPTFDVPKRTGTPPLTTVHMDAAFVGDAKATDQLRRGEDATALLPAASPAYLAGGGVSNALRERMEITPSSTHSARQPAPPVHAMATPDHAPVAQCGEVSVGHQKGRGSHERVRPGGSRTVEASPGRDISTPVSADSPMGVDGTREHGYESAGERQRQQVTVGNVAVGTADEGVHSRLASAYLSVLADLGTSKSSFSSEMSQVAPEAHRIGLSEQGGGGGEPKAATVHVTRVGDTGPSTGQDHRTVVMVGEAGVRRKEAGVLTSSPFANPMPRQAGIPVQSGTQGETDAPQGQGQAGPSAGKHGCGIVNVTGNDTDTGSGNEQPEPLADGRAQTQRHAWPKRRTSLQVKDDQKTHDTSPTTPPHTHTTTSGRGTHRDEHTAPRSSAHDDTTLLCSTTHRRYSAGTLSEGQAQHTQQTQPTQITQQTQQTNTTQNTQHTQQTQQAQQPKTQLESAVADVAGDPRVGGSTVGRAVVNRTATAEREAETETKTTAEITADTSLRPISRGNRTHSSAADGATADASATRAPAATADARPSSTAEQMTGNGVSGVDGMAIDARVRESTHAVDGDKEMAGGDSITSDATADQGWDGEVCGAIDIDACASEGPEPRTGVAADDIPDVDAIDGSPCSSTSVRVVSGCGKQTLAGRTNAEAVGKERGDQAVLTPARNTRSRTRLAQNTGVSTIRTGPTPAPKKRDRGKVVDVILISSEDEACDREDFDWKPEVVAKATKARVKRNSFGSIKRSNAGSVTRKRAKASGASAKSEPFSESDAFKRLRYSYGPASVFNNPSTASTRTRANGNARAKEKQRFADSEEFKRLRQTFGPASLAQRERAKQLHTAAAAATGTSEADLRPWPRRLGLTRLECFPTQPRLVLLPECTVFFSTTAHTKKTSSKAFGKAKKTATAPIVRISIRDEKGAIEIGRVPVEVGAFMHPLLQSGLVLFEGELDIGTQALKLGPMGRIAVKVRVRVRKELFTTVAATGKSDFSVGGASEKEDYDERVRAALLQLLMYMGLLAHQGGEFSVTEHGRASVDNDDVDGEGDVDEQLRDTLIATSASLTGHYNHMTMPHQLTASLREYQKEGVHWMLNRESLTEATDQHVRLHPLWLRLRMTDTDDRSTGTAFYINPTSSLVQLKFPAASSTVRGGILADEMGLGKTLQMLSVIVSTVESDRKLSIEKVIANPDDPTNSEKYIQGGTLVICPTSMLGQWQAEIDTHTKSRSLRYLAYHGTNRAKASELSVRNCDVVITTYGIVGSEINRASYATLKKIYWKRIVLDEGHYIKGRTTQQAKGVYGLMGDCRWIISGTPIQNRLDDLFSLIHFLQVSPYDDYAHWNREILKPFHSTDTVAKETAKVAIKAILSALMLRREKSTLDVDGKPIVVLPPKTVDTMKITASAEEQDFYTALYKRCKTTFDTFVATNKVMSNFSHVLELLLRLRQCCDHPLLVLSAPSKDLATMNDFNKFAKQFSKGTTQSVEFVKKTMDALKNDAAPPECPICLDPAEDAVLPPCGHAACRDCLMEMFGSITNQTIQCPICRVDVDRRSLMTAPRASRFTVDPNKAFQMSTKMKHLMDGLDALIHRRRARDPNAGKAIVFSQWTSMLDLVEIPLKERKFNYARLDGSTSQQKRVAILESFSSEKGNIPGSPDVLIMSLRAGGVGLNLTEANHVFILDQWWNYYLELQCMDRVHRIGQKRPVFVQRYVVVNTVEERILELQKRKVMMVEETMSMDNQERKEIRLEEIKLLFS